MFGSQWTKGTRKAERTTAQAWANLVSAVESTGDTARIVKKRTAHLADNAGTKVGAAADEARRRANAAVDALAGRRQPTPWGWLIGVTVAGAVVGWVGAMAARRLATREDDTVLTEEDLAEHELLPVA